MCGGLCNFPQLNFPKTSSEDVCGLAKLGAVAMVVELFSGAPRAGGWGAPGGGARFSPRYIGRRSFALATPYYFHQVKLVNCTVKATRQRHDRERKRKPAPSGARGEPLVSARAWARAREHGTRHDCLLPSCYCCVCSPHLTCHTRHSTVYLYTATLSRIIRWVA